MEDVVARSGFCASPIPHNTTASTNGIKCSLQVIFRRVCRVVLLHWVGGMPVRLQAARHRSGPEGSGLNLDCSCMNGGQAE